ncbi:hypothetical protein M0R88_12130 [Halorussus gelatinilyticus]|uniref:DUF7344 domain-containing protein n=1 Tax=Halorussus gelatinilyticus TaxID=2937524 RepID=A0A8U0IF01_9EURY|nr:hypothetical protein [Halorussus gelatinilyticus]UPV99270.1 hypothetical protein M0R88_12130 [Halorussus gelatinilyticus]
MSEQTGTENIDVSAAFDLLRDARRRGVIYTVKRNGRTSVSELARRIAAWQSTDGDDAPDRDTVETSLVHAHLPKLDDAGVVEYDREEGTVEFTETTSDLDPLLERTREREPTLVRAARTTNLERALEI